MKKTLAAFVSALLLVIASLSIVALRGAEAQPTNDIANHPDEAAWGFFAQATANTPGPRGVPTFTTWAGDEDTFGETPRFPGQPSALNLRRTILPSLFRTARPGAASAHGWTPSLLHDIAQEEVRRNRPAYDYIVNNRLNTRSGLIAAFGTNIVFPRGSIEVKTNWLAVELVPQYYRHPDGSRLTPADVRRLFFIADVPPSGTSQIVRQHALLSMHVITKQVPNWTWATFEHHLTPARCDYIGCRDSFGATEPVVRPRARAGGNYGRCEHTSRLRAMLSRARVDDIFLNYCLKGSQTDYTDPTGLPIVLGNSVTEGGFVTSSSCMTCHGTAGWDSTGASLPINTPVGAIPSSTYWAFGTTVPPGVPGATQIATAADFVWSIPFCVRDDITPTPPAGQPPLPHNPCFKDDDPGR